MSIGRRTSFKPSQALEGVDISPLPAGGWSRSHRRRFSPQHRLKPDLNPSGSFLSMNRVAQSVPAASYGSAPLSARENVKT